MNVRIEIHNRSVRKRKERIVEWKIPDPEKQAVARFLDELELGKVNKGRKISESRQCKYLDVLRPPLEFIGKSAEYFALEDIESFEKALCSGLIKSIRGEAYAHATKVDIRRALKIYLRWRLGSEKANSLTDWLDTRDLAKTPNYLKESEIERLYQACHSPEERFLIAVLFDTGARAGEFYNIRSEDIHLPENRDNFVKITLKEEYSKTKGRMVSLFWKNSVKAVRDYYLERQAQGMRSGEQVFNRSYDAARFFLSRLGMKVLKHPIHFHLFRHTSATFYAGKMNRQQLCIRYGWSFSSRMPDVYIARAGVDSQELDDKFARTTLEEYQSRLSRMEQESKFKDERLITMERELGLIKNSLPLISEILEKNPTKEDLKAALDRKAKVNDQGPF